MSETKRRTAKGSLSVVRTVRTNTVRAKKRGVTTACYKVEQTVYRVSYFGKFQMVLSFTRLNIFLLFCDVVLWMEFTRYSSQMSKFDHRAVRV